MRKRAWGRGGGEGGSLERKSGLPTCKLHNATQETPQRSRACHHQHHHHHRHHNITRSERPSMSPSFVQPPFCRRRTLSLSSIIQTYLGFLPVPRLDMSDARTSNAQKGSHILTQPAPSCIAQGNVKPDCSQRWSTNPASRACLATNALNCPCSASVRTRMTGRRFKVRRPETLCERRDKGEYKSGITAKIASLRCKDTQGDSVAGPPLRAALAISAWST